jgi:hypothetical protein
VFPPDLAPHEFDDEAMADYAAEFGWPADDEQVLHSTLPDDEFENLEGLLLGDVQEADLGT